MAKKDYKALAAGIIEKAGGAGNIASVTHCMTRLRLCCGTNPSLIPMLSSRCPAC